MINLKAIRKAKGISAEELSERTGLSRTQIWHYEAGRREPPVNALCALADALGVTLDELVRGKKEEPLHAQERLASIGTDAVMNLPPEQREIALAVLTALRAEYSGAERHTEGS